MGLISQHPISTFSSPVNGTTPIDANVVKGNDNTIKTAYNAHDADGTIHLQNGAVGTRPAAATAGNMWLATDAGAAYLYFDTGSVWSEVNYLRNTGGTITGNLAVTGTITGTSADASAFAIGLNGATNPAFVVDSSTALQAAGLKVTGAVAAGSVAVAVVSSGSNANLTLNAKGSGTIGIGSVSTGAVTITPATTITGAATLSSTLGVAGNITQTTNNAFLLGKTTGGVSVVVIGVDAADHVIIDNSALGATFNGALTALGNVVVGASKLTVNATTGATVAASTFTGTRVIGGTDIASAVAKGVFSDGNYSSTTDASVTAVFGALTSYSNAAGSGTVINQKTQLLQTVATSGTVYALHNVAQATHTSGTVAAILGQTTNTYITGSGGTTTAAIGINVKAIIGAGATVTGLIGMRVDVPTNSGTVTTNVGIDVVSQSITGSVALRTSSTASGSIDDVILNATGAAAATNATQGFVFIPNCAGTPTGVPVNDGTGRTAMRYDTSANKIWFYNGSWRGVVVS